MKKVFTLMICALLVCALIFAGVAQVSAESANPLTEAQILDEMAQSWIETCVRNELACIEGQAIYALGKISPDHELLIKVAVKEMNESISDFQMATPTIQVKLDSDDLAELCIQYGSEELLEDMEIYANTGTAEILTEEWEAHMEAMANINDTIKNGELADGVDMMDVIAENYAFVLGEISCEMARQTFQQAKATNDLAEKRKLMIQGARLATFGCEMSIEKADEVVKGSDLKKSAQDIMADIAETSVDVVSKIVPEVKILTQAINIAAEIGVSMLSMREKVDALSGFLAAPDTIEANKSDFYDAISNQYDKFTYEIKDFEIIMDEYNGYLLVGHAYERVDVPDNIYGFPVVEFGGVLADNLPITEIKIPSTIRSRSLLAVISDCDKLKKVEYNAINCKGWYLHYFFEDCYSNFEVVFGPGIQSIPERFISNCGITTIAFPEGVTTINAGALKNCPNLKTVTIPSTVETFAINFDAPGIVDGCANLEKVYYNAISPEGSYYNAVLSGCGNSAEDMQIIFGEGIQNTPANFIYNCGVKTVTFPEGMTSIREYAIGSCQRLETITIPSTVVSFNENLACDFVFAKCDNLKTVNYNAQNAVNGVGAYLFYENHSDFTINFGEDIVNIPANFMSLCDATEVHFPEGVKTIGYNCLVDCDALKTVTVPSTVETIEYHFIYRCDAVQTVYFNANCATSPDTAMISDSGNKEKANMQVLLGENVTTVPAHFIKNCAISEFVYPEGIKTIRTSSLTNCSTLEKVVIPSTLEKYGSSVVSNCANLKRIEYNAQNAKWLDYSENYMFRQSGNGTGLQFCFGANVESIEPYFVYDCGVVSAEFPNGLKVIPKRAFYSCDYLTSVTIPASVTTIKDGAFSNSEALTEIHFNAIAMEDLSIANGAFGNGGHQGTGITVTIGSQVTRIPAYLLCSSDITRYNPKITSVQFAANSACTTIGKYAFSRCDDLTSIQIPNSVTTIGNGAFSHCTGLTSFTIPNSVTTIGDSAFSNCTSLTGITIPNSVTTIGEAVFADCTGLTNVTIGNRVTHIAGKAFNGCTALTGIALPDSITSIDYSAFSGCTALAGITMQDGVTKIAMNAFQNCSALNSVIYCGTEAQWNEIDIANYNNKDLLNANRQYHDWTKDPETGREFCRICKLSKCDALGHTWQDATCTTPKTCSACGTTEGNAKGHTWQTATCTTPKTCTTCKLTEGSALGHNWQDATCDKPMICSRCKASSGRPAGHTYDDGVDGTCNGCGIHREETEDRTVMHMFRMYDPNSGEHFYTGSTVERDNLVAAGWNYEGVGFTFSLTTGAPVYRLYDRYDTFEHLYTMDVEERDRLVADGWELEGIAFNSAYDTEVPQYRLHNPNETRGAYHFTASEEERDALIAAGWEYQGIGFYSSWK